MFYSFISYIFLLYFTVYLRQLRRLYTGGFIFQVPPVSERVRTGIYGRSHVSYYGFLIDRNSLPDKSLPHQNIVFVYKFSYKSNIIICAYFLNSISSPWAQGFLHTVSGRSALPYTTAGQLNRLLQPLKYIRRRYTVLEHL